MSLNHYFSAALNKATNLVWPPRSLLSNKRIETQSTIEAEIWKDLPFLSGPKCFCCGVPMEDSFHPESLCGPCIAVPPHFDIARAVLAYDDLTRPLVLALKHAGRKDGVKLFAKWMKQYCPNDSDLIVPVPSHWTRLFERGFNQAAWLAQALARETKIKWSPEILIRHRKTNSQNGLSTKGRARNVQGAFSVKGDIKGKNIILIDDVYTTGSTLDACAKALKKAGAKKVIAIALLRVCKPIVIEEFETPIIEKLDYEI